MDDDQDQTSLQTNQANEWTSSFQSIEAADEEEKEPKINGHKKRNAKRQHVDNSNFFEDFGSSLSESAAEGSGKPKKLPKLSFNPLSGRGRLMAEIARKKNILYYRKRYNISIECY